MTGGILVFVIPFSPHYETGERLESSQLHLAYAKIRETIPAMAQRMDDLRNTRSGGGGGSSSSRSGGDRDR